MTRTAYFNGKFVPETEVLIPYRDRSFNRGDGCFDRLARVDHDRRVARGGEHLDAAVADAIDWVRRMRRDGGEWEVLPE